METNDLLRARARYGSGSMANVQNVGNFIVAFLMNCPTHNKMHNLNRHRLLDVSLIRPHQGSLLINQRSSSSENERPSCSFVHRSRSESLCSQYCVEGVGFGFRVLPR